MVVAGSDGEPTVQQLGRVATGLRWRQVCAPLRVCTRAQSMQAILAPKQLSAQQQAQAQEWGATLGAGLVLGVF